MQFNRTVRSTVLDRIDSQRSARQHTAAENEQFEQVILTGRSTPVSTVEINHPAKSRLSPFESELLDAWSQD